MTDSVSIIGQVFRSIEAEVDEVKNGELSEARARIVNQQRKNQIKLMEVDLGFQRLVRTSMRNGSGSEPLLQLDNKKVEVRKRKRRA